MRFSLFRGAGGALLCPLLTACQPATDEAELKSVTATLHQVNAVLETDNQAIVSQIETEVARSYWQRRDEAVLRQAEAVRARTQAEVQYLRRLRQWLQSAPPAPLPAGAIDSLQRQLRVYGKFLRPYLPTPAPLVADTLAAPVEPSRPLPPAPQFLVLNLADAPPAAALATLTRLEADVRQTEQQALSRLSQQVGGTCGPWFYPVSLATAPEAQAVRAGDVYRADMFLSVSNGIATPISRVAMEVDGQPLGVDKTRQALVTFRVPATAAPGPAFWTGTVRLPGRDSVLSVRVPYLIQPR